MSDNYAKGHATRREALWRERKAKQYAGHGFIENVPEYDTNKDREEHSRERSRKEVMKTRQY